MQPEAHVAGQHPGTPRSSHRLRVRIAYQLCNVVCRLYKAAATGSRCTRQQDGVCSRECDNCWHQLQADLLPNPRLRRAGAR